MKSHRRKRRKAEPGEFQDPLSNYNPPEYDDNLERALTEATVGDMQITPFMEVSADTTVQEAVQMMEQDQIACLMVVKDQRLIGVFSERDVLNKVAAQHEQVKSRPIRDLMTPDPQTVYETDSPAKALNLMAVGGFRHIPVLGVDDRPTGILGPKRTTAFLQEHFE